MDGEHPGHGPWDVAASDWVAQRKEAHRRRNQQTGPQTKQSIPSEVSKRPREEDGMAALPSSSLNSSTPTMSIQDRLKSIQQKTKTVLNTTHEDDISNDKATSVPQTPSPTPAPKMSLKEALLARLQQGGGGKA
eukprot:PhF_6_TR11430/c0_g1_i1/m.18378